MWLGRLYLKEGNMQKAKAYLTIVAKGAEEEIGSTTFQDAGETTANIFDDAIAACVLSKDTAEVVRLWESQRSSRLLRKLGLKPTSETELRKALSPGLGLIYLNVSPVGSSGTIISRNSSETIWTPNFRWEDLQMCAGPWLKSMYYFHKKPDRETEAMFREGINRTLNALRPFIFSVAECLLLLGIRKVVLIPGNGISTLPLHAIPLIAKYLRFCDSFKVIYSPNATFWLWANYQQRKRIGVGEFAGFAYPGRKGYTFRIEVEKAAKLCNRGKGVYVGKNATAKNLWEVAPHVALLHISCHGSFELLSDEDPELNAKAGIGMYHDWLSWDTLRKRLYLPLSRLVVLSACETLLTSHRDIALRYFGLPYAFLSAGAPLILGTNWVVEGFSTALLMTRFYENLLLKEMAASAALAEAQHWIRTLDRGKVKRAIGKYFGYRRKLSWRLPDRAVEHPYEHPYYWAGFRLIGADFSMMVEKNETQ